MTPWKCSQCGELHETIPNSFSLRSPIYWNRADEQRQTPATWIDSNYCVIGGEHFYIRGTLEIPILGSGEFFIFGVWSSLGPSNFARACEMASNAARIYEPPNFGWFSNRLKQYPDTLNLKCKVITQPICRRPLFELEPTDHPLAIEQRNGITEARFQELSEQYLHNWKHPDSAA